VKIFLRARLDTAGRVAKYGDGQIEIYDRNRFFTVTGRRLNGASLQIEEHQANVSWLVGLISSNNAGIKTSPKKADLKKQRNVSEGARYLFLRNPSQHNSVQRAWAK
jgi:hypothetical protein